MTAGQVTLTFERETAFATRLAGLGSQVEVLCPASVRTRPCDGQGILEVYSPPREALIS